MKKPFKLLKILAFGLAAVSLTGCFGSFMGGSNKEKTSEVGDDVINAKSITLNKDAITLEVNMEDNLIATIAPDDTTDKTITWTSSKPTVATVDSAGLVTSVGVGSATITAKTANGKSDSCKVTVVDTPLINNEKFTKEKLYIFSGTFQFKETTTQYDVRYTFKTDGNLVAENKIDNTSENYTYKVIDKMIYIYSGETLNSMFFYYDNVIMAASELPFILTRDGSAVSQKGTSTLGYYAVIDVNVGDSLGVLTGSEGSKGYYIILQENGSLKDTTSSRNIKYVSGDQISASDFDTSKAGKSIIKITIGTKQYNCLLIVR